MRDGVYWTSSIKPHWLVGHVWTATIYRPNRVDVTSSGWASSRLAAEARRDFWLEMMGELP